MASAPQNPKLIWFPFFIDKAKASKTWNLPDFQWCWFWKLIINSFDSERPGYLPDNPDELWRLAGAKSRPYFEKWGGRELVSGLFQRTEIDGTNWIYNRRAYQTCVEAMKKLKIPTNPQSTEGESVSSISKQLGFGVALLEIDTIDSRIEQLFEEYRALFERDKRYKLTDKYRKLASTRLLECLSECRGDIDGAMAMMREAMQKLALDEWRIRTGQYDWDKHLFASREIFQERLAFKVIAKTPPQAGTERKPVSEEKARCIWPDCNNLARKDSKTCSDECQAKSDSLEQRILRKAVR